MLTPITLGNKITEARKAKNLSQSQLAQQLAISSQAVGKWERGESMPDILTFNRLAEVLGVDLNYFSESFPSNNTEKAPVAVWPSAELTVETKQPFDAPPAPEMPEKRLSWDLSMGNWVDADFSGLKNLGEKFSASNLQRCLFIGSDMSGLVLSASNVDTCDFSNSDFSNSSIQTSSVVKSSFRGCSLIDAEFSKSHIKNCDFTGADFTGATFKLGDLQKNTLAGAVWNRTIFYMTQFIDVVFDGIINGCSFEMCDFSRTTFQNVTLTDTFFKTDGLKRVKFINCKADRLSYAFLKSGKADMTGITILT